MAKIKMRVNHNENSTCDLCQTKWKFTSEMYDLCINKNIFTICMDCSNDLLMKLLKADCLFNGKVKSAEDLKRIRRHHELKGYGRGFN